MVVAFRWLACSLVAVVAPGCAGRPRVYAPVARAALPQPPADGVCKEVSDCERRCPAGEARACSELGDLVHERDWDRAADLWKQACDRDDGLGCLRAMGLHPGVEADSAAAKACAAGFASACGVIGRAQLLRGLALWSGAERRGMLRDAVELLERSCRLEDWTGCMTAAAAHVAAGGKDARMQARLLGARAAELADKACFQSDAVACAVLAEDRDEQGDRAGATAYYSRACALQLDTAAQVSAEARATAASEGNCKLLAGRGAPLPEPLTPTSGTRRIAREIVEARRKEGLTQIHPSQRTKGWLYNQRRNKLVSRLQVCASPVGLVEGIVVLDYSGAPDWDAALVQAVRRWRFRPHRADGVPSPFCFHYTFIYHQR